MALICLLVLAFGSAREASAGAFIFAGEANGVDVISHPTGYSGSGGVLPVSVCIDPTSANAASMEVPVQNAVNTFRRLVAETGNVLLGASNDVPTNAIDWESVAVHELGHCIGLAHVNAASESGLTGSNQNYTKATDGIDNVFNLDDGTDNVIGSSDDIRGDDQNLFYFRKATNDPFTIEPTTIDSTTYSRDLADLPVGHTFATNGDRAVSTLLGLPLSESVMQQGTFSDEAQRELTHDDVATLKLAMSGLDEKQGTGDDYTIDLTYAGLTTGCDIVIDFDAAQTSFAVCQTGGVFVGPPPFAHVAITSANIFYNPGFNFHFSSVLTYCGNGELDDGEECDDGNADDGDCCSSVCLFDALGSSCSGIDACIELETCDGAGLCENGSPLPCDDGAFCNGDETCDSLLGCQPGTPPGVDDGVSCTDDSCDEVGDIIVHSPTDGNCDDLLFCNGPETCDLTLDCLAGTPPVVDDGVACTDDGCDEVGDSVVHLPNDALCDDLLFCNGAELCDVTLDCQSGVSPLVDDGVSCTDDSCDEVGDLIVHSPNDALCNDSLMCTVDTCDAELDCQNAPINMCVEVLVPTSGPKGHAVLIGLLIAFAIARLASVRERIQ